MRKLVGAWIVAVSVVSAAEAQVPRFEFLAIPSVTMPDRDFLKGGRKAASPALLGGVLRLPKTGGEKLPAVVLLHASGGIGGSGSLVDLWASELNGIGLATLTVDSFSGRGIAETTTDQNRLGRLNMIIDAYRALELLANHRQIDPARIAVMGFSRGAQSALYASLARFYRLHGPANLRFAAHVSLYPDCSTTFLEDDKVVGPVRILHGSADDYNPMGPCLAYAQRLEKAGKDVSLIAYEDAHHVFDWPALKEPRKLAAATTLRQCKLMEGENGAILNRDTKQPFTYADPCVQKGPTIGHSAVSAEKARADVKSFLSSVLGVKG